MENELKDFDDWIQEIESYQPTYSAVYNPESGVLIKVGPTDAFIDDQYKIEIDYEFMLDISEGRIRLQNCYVDPYTEQIEILSKGKITDKDLILYSIPEVTEGWLEFSEIYLTYKNSILEIEMTDVYGGSRTFAENSQVRKPIWDDNTKLVFLVTDFNDPYVIHKIVRLTVSDLKENKISVNINNPPKKISVYTQKLFKKYLLEKIDENS